ncbi:MAG TPA: F420-dependent hydroxymycolic acid dehydrogenase [Pseudonocardiaceae bacterium]|nr:F420-dependent hydroxymycolic acid dehydrogenase [Pseudonocardiaceae bacterium]
MDEYDGVGEPAQGLSRRKFSALGMLALGGAAAGLTATAACGSPASTPRSGSSATGQARVGFVLSSEQFPTSKLVELAAAAEQAGFGHLWASDHLQPWQDNEGHSSFPWLTLGLVSQRTRTAIFGTGVTCPTYRHHPTDVAQAFATLTGLAPGRVFLGVGTGEALNELAGTGQFGRYPERHDRLIEAITLIRQLWSGQRVSFRGRYFQTEQLQLYDLPQQPPPIYVAAGGPKSATLAGQYGDGWITTGGSVNTRLRVAFEQGARAAGKDPAHMPIFLERFVIVGDGPQADYAAQRWRFLAAPPTARLLYQPNPVTIEQIAQQVPLGQVSPSWLVGTDPSTHIAAVQKLLDAGVTPFIHAPQADPGRVIDFYGQRVLPQLHT